MKVERTHLGNELDGTFVPSGLATEKFLHKAKITGAELQNGDFGERFVIKFDPPFRGGDMISLNRTSLKRVVAEYGDETEKWAGRKVELKPEKVKGLKGSFQAAVTVTPCK
jgi:hypothetical protein